MTNLLERIVSGVMQRKSLSSRSFSYAMVMSEFGSSMLSKSLSRSKRSCVGDCTVS